MSSEAEFTLWKLSELANQDSDDIESNEIEIIGEDELGRDVCSTEKITEIARDSLKLIEQQEQTIKQQAETIESQQCEFSNILDICDIALSSTDLREGLSRVKAATLEALNKEDV